MTAKDWPAFKDMNWLRLLEGPADHAELDVAPTMTYVIHAGQRYNRMPDSRAPRPEGSGEARTVYGGTYLWEGWWGQMLAAAAAEKQAATGTGAGQ